MSSGNILNQPLVELHSHNETELHVEDQEYHLFLLEPMNQKILSTQYQQEIQHSKTCKEIFFIIIIFYG